MPRNRIATERDGRRITIVGAIVNASLIVLKLIAGILGRSQALIADAIHSVSDLFTDAVVLFGLKLGRKDPDENHPFGHARLETLASSIVGIALTITALSLGVVAVLNIYNHVVYKPTALALVGAGASVALKEALYHYTIRTGRRVKSQLIVANAWHHRSDSLSSVAVFFGVGGSLLHPSWHILDSFAMLLVSFFIIKVGLEILGKTLIEFTDTAPKPEVVERMKQCALSIDGVMNIHDLRVRISGGLYQIETHVEVNSELSVVEGHRIAKSVENCLLDEIDDVDRVIIHVDPKNPD